MKKSVTHNNVKNLAMNRYPVVGVGAVVIYNAKVLLVQRATPPYQGQWCIPGGKVRFGETLQQAAEREIREETGITVEAGEPIYSFEIIDTSDTENPVHYVVIDLEASYLSGDIKAASDALEVAWFSKAEILDKRVEEHTKQFLRKWWLESRE